MAASFCKIVLHISERRGEFQFETFYQVRAKNKEKERERDRERQTDKDRDRMQCLTITFY